MEFLYVVCICACVCGCAVEWRGVAWSDELYVEKSNYVGKYYYIFLHAVLDSSILIYS